MTANSRRWRWSKKKQTKVLFSELGIPGRHQPPTVDTWLCSGIVTEADVWLCYEPGNKTGMWLCCIQRSRCCHHTAITICTDEIRDPAVLDVWWLLSLKVKYKINNHASWWSREYHFYLPRFHCKISLLSHLALAMWYSRLKYVSAVSTSQSASMNWSGWMRKWWRLGEWWRDRGKERCRVMEERM